MTLYYLKVVPKRPGPQHLEEGVMVDIFTHIVQIVVFASCTDTFLGVGSTTQPGHGMRWIDGVEKDGLELGERGTKSTCMYFESLQQEPYHFSTDSKQCKSVEYV